MGHDAGPEFVVEFEFSVVDRVFKVNVDAAFDLRQRQIMCSQEADGVTCEQASHNSRGTNQAIVRIRPAEQFVQKKQDRTTPLDESDDLPDTKDFRQETRAIVLERICCPDGSAQANGGDVKARSRYRGAPRPARSSFRSIAAACSCPTYSSRSQCSRRRSVFNAISFGTHF